MDPSPLLQACHTALHTGHKDTYPKQLPVGPALGHDVEGCVLVH